MNQTSGQPTVPTTTPEGRPQWAKLIMAVVAGILVAVAVDIWSAYQAAWEKMLRLDCRHSLNLLGLLCREYAAVHEGRFPSTWVELESVEYGTNSIQLFRCPSAGHEIGAWAQVDSWSDYRLLPGRSTNDPPDRLLALEPPENHQGAGGNVLFVDGSTQWWPPARLLKAATNNVTR